MEIHKFTEKLNQKIGEPQALSLIRTQGLKALAELNWPTRKLEGWKYSPIHFLKKEFVPQVNTQENSNSLNINNLLSVQSSKSFYSIVIENGKILSISPELISKLQIFTLREALEKGFLDSSEFSKIENSLEALNVSLLDSGFYIKLNDHEKIEQPIHWLQCYSATENNPLFQSRLTIEIGEYSSCTFIESHYHVSPSEIAWINTSTNLLLKDHSKLNFIQWNETNSSLQHTSRTRVIVEDCVVFHHLLGSLSNGWTRNELSVSCHGINSELNLHGLGLSIGSGIIDQQSKLIFHGESNKSEQIYKNIVLDNSKAIFSGQISIKEQAQKTDSSQLHQTLLLSSQAEVDTKPQLEIYADDVKATHGATVGQLDEDELFYIQSRGISLERARSMLCLAFLVDLCERISAPKTMHGFLKNRIENYWKRVLE